MTSAELELTQICSAATLLKILAEKEAKKEYSFYLPISRFQVVEPCKNGIDLLDLWRWTKTTRWHVDRVDWHSENRTPNVTYGGAFVRFQYNEGMSDQIRLRECDSFLEQVQKERIKLQTLIDNQIDRSQLRPLKSSS